MLYRARTVEARGCIVMVVARSTWLSTTILEVRGVKVMVLWSPRRVLRTASGRLVSRVVMVGINILDVSLDRSSIPYARI